MTTVHYKYLRIIGLILTILIFVGHYFLPQKRVSIHPLATSHPQLYGYADPQSGESAYWVNESVNEWACLYKQEHVYGCGWDVYWDENYTKGIDLSVYESIELNIHYEGSASRVRVYMRNYNSAYAKEKDSLSNKMLSMTFRTDEADKPVIIHLNEFNVASWWLREREIPRQWSRPEFENITKIGVDFVEKGAHFTRVDSIVLLGKWIKTEALILLVLAFWMSVFLLEGVVRFYQLYIKSINENRLITELQLKQLNLEEEKVSLKDIVDHDPLTGIFSRQALESHVKGLFCDRASVAEYGVLLLDLDRFKNVNDTYGHDVGDTVLKVFATVIADTLRQDDFFARWGGEEFVVICKSNNISALFNLAEKLRETIAQTCFSEDLDLKISVSIGMSSMHSDEDFDDVFNRADEALYGAKAKGRNRVEYKV
ncbi:GGDEF domain-containing protein [Teredinibacter haidensis]|uniref:GGDEF domain-containing protein n=1 Tax=Teredinibacter haidensis TaxID=2731755 RepID=UPI000948AF24|nr:GGDEF domain-containing protein [Teredinibacter haidensis]